MENKLSKGGELRIKSPQLYQPAPSVNQALPSPTLHNCAADRSALRSAGEGSAAPPDALCRCGHRRDQHEPIELTLTISCLAYVGMNDCGVRPTYCPCDAFAAAEAPEASASACGRPCRSGCPDDDRCDSVAAPDPRDVAPRATLVTSSDPAPAVCTCARLNKLAAVIRKGGMRVAGFMGPGCALHAWTGVRL